MGSPAPRAALPPRAQALVPLPCVAPLVRLAPLVRAGVLDGNDVAALETIRAHNPLLFDFVLKRRAAWRGARLQPAVFATRRHFAALHFEARMAGNRDATATE
jgi:hypothetical protein